MSMKLLIGYDGSEFANDAIDDLRRAGLPADVEALVLTVADAWPPSLQSAGIDVLAQLPQAGAAELRKQSLAEANMLALEGVNRIRSYFPDWQITSEVSGDAPIQALIKRADEWQPDLFVVGSHGRSPVGRFFLGSVSLTVVQNALCSVRVSRRRTGLVGHGAVRIVIGVDGSKESAAAIQALAMRKWPSGSEAMAITVLNLRSLGMPESLLNAVAPRTAANCDDGRAWARRALDRAAEELRENGLITTPVVREGDPARILVRDAQEWGADCIFVGAKGLTRVERLTLGSVSSAVVTRAHCSVEVVRQA